MIEFITKYWVEFIFGIIAAWLLKQIKHIQDLEKASKEATQKKIEEDIMKDVDKKISDLSEESVTEDKVLHDQLDGLDKKVDSMTKAILSLQGRQFKDNCRYLLKDEHEITVDEYMECIADHDAYNGIGGNHQGDLLFKAVCKKYNAQVQE